MINSIEQDITRKVINTTEILREVKGVFSDSIVLNEDFTIQLLGDKVVSALGYPEEELVGMPVSCLSNAFNFETFLRENLFSGYFKQIPLQLRGTNNAIVDFYCSGLYLGLVTDLSGSILLNLRKRSAQPAGQPDDKLDNFIYHSAHVLRGPLATLKGLIGITKDSKEPEEIKFLVNKMADYANKLDDLLQGLTQAASGFQVSGSRSNNVDVLGHDLRKLLQQMNLTTSTELHLRYDKTLTQINEAKSIALILQSLIRFTVQHNQKELNHISLTTTRVDEELSLLLTLDDVQFSDEIIQHLNSRASLEYTMVLLNPGLAYLFSAMKGLSVLRGSLDCESDIPNSITFNISFPLHRE